MPVTPPSHDLAFAPVGIAHLTDDNADLIAAAARGRTRLRFTTAAQLNGVPHLGTVVTVAAVFALAAHCARALDRPASILFDALENAPAEHIDINGHTYTRTVGDLIDNGTLDANERSSAFHQLLDWAAARSHIRYEFRPYVVYQGLAPVRECMYRIADDQQAFAPIVAPADGIIKIRPRCPACRLMQKGARDLRITTSSDAVHLASHCPHHGRYTETVPIDGTGGWYDANTPVRSIQKGFLLAAERNLYDAASVSVDGADWGGAWHSHVLAPGLAQLAVPPATWPVSIFTPLITDATGGKLSKTLYVRKGTYADLPETFLNLNVLLASRGETVLESIWTEVSRWAAEPRRLHRSYSVDYFAAIIGAGATPRADRAA